MGRNTRLNYPHPPPTLDVEKDSGCRTWMRMDSKGNRELLECERHVIMNRAQINARVLRILGPAYSSNILAREKAIVTNLEFIKAVIMVEEVYILDPHDLLVNRFVEQLRHQLSSSEAPTDAPRGTMTDSQGPMWMSLGDQAPDTLPFEFRVLEVALEVVCVYLQDEVGDLERVTYPALEELTKNISTGVLERIRRLKTKLGQLASRVQKVRDEIEHFLDDDSDMADMYISRKIALQQQAESILNDESDRADSVTRAGTSVALGTLAENDGVEDLEMLLETSFLHIDSTRNRLATIREYIEDTEDYVNIQLRNHRNEMIQLQMVLILAGFVIGLATAVSGVFGMNIPYAVDERTGFIKTILGTLFGSVGVFFTIYGYARWKELLGT